MLPEEAEVVVVVIKHVGEIIHLLQYSALASENKSISGAKTKTKKKATLSIICPVAGPHLEPTTFILYYIL